MVCKRKQGKVNRKSQPGFVQSLCIEKTCAEASLGQFPFLFLYHIGWMYLPVMMCLLLLRLVFLTMG
ncbi:hypothetical protein ACFX2I_023657 [Malus domestica]